MIDASISDSNMACRGSVNKMEVEKYQEKED